MVTVSEEDKRKFRRQAEDLALFETDELVHVEDIPSFVERTNAMREAAGIPPIDSKNEDDPNRPEEELARRARALGMARRRR